MKLNIILLIFVILLSSFTLAAKLECIYNNGVTKIVDLYQCPPVLKEFHKLQDPEVWIDKQGYGSASSGGGGSTISMYDYPEQITASASNESCYSNCSKCYTEGSDEWYDCMHKSIEQNLDDIPNNLKNTKIVLSIVIIILIITIIVLFTRGKKK